MQMTDNQVKSNNALALCPFCGGEAQVMKMDLDSIDEGWKVWGVWCVNDLHAKDYYNHGHYIDNYPTESEAIAAWNSRVERTCKVISHRTFCGAGGCEEAGELWTLSCGHEVMNDSDYPPNFCDECGCKVVDE